MTEELAVPAIVRSVGAMAIEAPGSVGALLVTLVVNVALQITTSALGAEGGVLRMVMLTSTWRNVIMVSCLSIPYIEFPRHPTSCALHT